VADQEPTSLAKKATSLAVDAVLGAATSGVAPVAKRLWTRRKLILAIATPILGMVGALLLLVSLVFFFDRPPPTTTNNQPPANPVLLTGPVGQQVPSTLIPTFEGAAAGCAGMPWEDLAAIAKIETDFTIETSSAGAEGMMQFLPATFAAYDHPVPADSLVTPVPPGVVPQTPVNVTDAVYASARMLCTDGAVSNLRAAAHDYNAGSPSTPSQTGPCPPDEGGSGLTCGYGERAVGWEAIYAAEYGSTAPVSTTSSPILDEVVNFAESQLGTPYLWGGTGDGGFDCSGLTQAAYRAAGVEIPRTSEEQFAFGRQIPITELQPGDLVFSRGSDYNGTGPGHVGIYVGRQGGTYQMIDAPYTGAVVRVDNFNPATTTGAMAFLGATDPALASSGAQPVS